MSAAISRTVALLLLPVALVWIGDLVLAAGTGTSRVAFYMDQSNGVLDLQWDNGPAYMRVQLEQLGFEVSAETAGQPSLEGHDAPLAYIIPAQKGRVYYSAAEDMSALASYVKEGGLVVLLSANHGHGEAMREFVSSALGYDGNWINCKEIQSSAKESFGAPLLSRDAASSFIYGLEDVWPSKLEDARTITYSTWCRHEDLSAVTLPFYNSPTDNTNVAAQVFGKAGTRGAVVWLGYDWSDGPQAQWGALLRELVAAFAVGFYEPPKSGNPDDDRHFDIDSVLEVSADVAEAAAEVVRRMLELGPSGTYPSPTAPSPSQPPSRMPNPPALPPGLSMKASRFTAVFDTPVTDEFDLIGFINNVKATIAKFYRTTQNMVIINFVLLPNGTDIRGPLRRRAMEAPGQRVYSAAEVDVMFGRSGPRPVELVLLSSENSCSFQIDQMRQLEADVIRRFLESDEATAGELQIGYTVLRIIAVPFPPSPPPSPPLAPGQFAPPLAPPRSPTPPPLAPAAPPVNLTALEAALGAADIANGWHPPSPPPPSVPSPPPMPPSPYPSPMPPNLTDFPPPQSPSSKPPSPQPSSTPPTPIQSSPPQSPSSKPPSPQPSSSPPNPIQSSPPQSPSSKPPSPQPSSSPPNPIQFSPPQPTASQPPSPKRPRTRPSTPIMSPPPHPSLPPPPSPPPLFIKFTNKTAQGAVGKSRSLVWNDDSDFRQQLTNQSPLQLVDLTKPDCPSTCGACPFAWKTTASQLSVAVFFKEPTQISRVFLKQIKNSGVITVQFLKWVYPPAGVIDGNVGRTVWNVTDDTSMCQSVLVLRIGPKKSGIDLPVPEGGSQASLPAKLQATATGGVLITMERPPNAGLNYGPFLEWVRFNGRVLYPTDASRYSSKHA